MPTAIIADDEQHLSEYIKTRLNALWPELEIVYLAPNGLQALAQISALEPDIAFLDIKMPGMSGLEVASKIGGVHVVFITAFNEFAVDAFEREAVDYLLKPVSDERLKKTIDKLKAKLAQAQQPEGVVPDSLQSVLAKLQLLTTKPTPQYLRFIRANRGELTHQVPVDEVLYFDADDKYTVVQTRSGEYLIRTPLSELAAELDAAQFQQIHRSTLVNMEAVAATRRDLTGRLYVRIRNHEKELPVSRAYVHLFKQH